MEPRPRHAITLLLVAFTLLACLVWFSGSMYGAWAIECGVGSIAHDLAFGLNPKIPLPDYYDGWTSGYLIAGLLGAPLQWLPFRSVYELKVLAVLYQALILCLAWLFLERNVSRRAAFVGTVLLTFAPPQLTFYAIHAGDYHYTELVFDLGMAILLAEVAIHGRRGLGWYAALGGVCGLALTNCLGSAPYVATTVGLLWLIDKRAMFDWRFLAAPVAGLLGVAPQLYKLLHHDPYMQGRGPVGAKLFYVGASDDSSHLLPKLLEIPTGYTSSLGFPDALHFAVPWSVGWVISSVHALASGAALLALLVLGAPALLRLARAAVPLPSFALDDAGKRRAGELILAVFAVAFVGAYLLSNQRLVADHPTVSQFRSNRFLPPMIALLALNTGVAVELVAQRWEKAGRLLAAVWVPLAAAGFVAYLGMVDWAGLSTSRGIPFRGHCYDLHGHYGGVFLPDVEFAFGAPDRWAPVDFCEGFPPEGRASCFRGRVWAVGKRHVREQDMFFVPPDRWQPDRGLTVACEALPDDAWRRDCYRQAGWAINWGVVKARKGPAWQLLPAYCAAMPTEEAAGWCVEGGGFFIGDHYALAPWKFDHLAPPGKATPETRAHLAAGIGYALTHYLELPARADEVCAQYGAVDPALEAPCREGADAGYGVYERPWPPWEGWPSR